MLFLSIHPEFARSILNGRKTVELRKRRPRAEAGTQVVIYATTPTCEVVATATVAKIESNSPGKLWSDVRKFADVEKQAFNAYFLDCELAVGIHLSDVKVLKNPIPLSELRRLWDNFHPPQQFRYLNQDQQQLIHRQTTVSIAPDNRLLQHEIASTRTARLVG